MINLSKKGIPANPGINGTANITDILKYLDQVKNNLNGKIDDNTNAILELMLLILIRVTSLEDWKARESGEVDLPFSNNDDPYLVGKAAMAISNVTMSSIRLQQLENEVMVVKQVIVSMSDSIQQNIHAAANAIATLSGFAQALYDDVKNINNRLLNVEAAIVGGVPDKLLDDSIEGASTYWKGYWNIYRKTLDLVAPELIPFAEVANALAEAVINNADDAEKRNKTFDYMRAGPYNAQLIANHVNDIGQHGMPVRDTDMISTPYMLSFMESFNGMMALFNDDVTALQLPQLNYYLKPVQQLGGPIKKLGQITLDFINKRKDLNIQMWTNRIPVHGFVSVVYKTSNENYRRQIVMSVGTGLDVQFILENGVTSFVNFVDRLQIHNPQTDKWEHFATIDTSLKNGAAEFENDILGSSIVETYTISYSYNFIVNFMKCMVIHEENYDLFTHNCQTMCREIINYCVAGSLPHFWKSQCSQDALLAEFSDKYQLPTDSPAYPMPRTSVVQTNHLTVTGTNPNMLTYFRNLEQANKLTWIDILS